MGRRNKVTDHFDDIAARYDSYKAKNWYYYGQIKKLLRTHIPRNKVVLEIGCGTGDLLSYVDPKLGVGIDISREMVRFAGSKHPDSTLKFIQSDAGEYRSTVKFDYIFMVDVIEHLVDVKKSIHNISKLMDKETKFINLMANPKWEWILMLAERLKLKMPEGPHKRLAFSEINEIYQEGGLHIFHHSWSTLIPSYIPLVTPVCNTYIEPVFKEYAAIEYFLAQKK